MQFHGLLAAIPMAQTDLSDHYGSACVKLLQIVEIDRGGWWGWDHDSAKPSQPIGERRKTAPIVAIDEKSGRSE